MLPSRAVAPVVPVFTPVPRRARSDGWTEARQRDFIASLAATGSVAVACDSVGLHVSGAYKLRSEPGGASFVRAWNEALDAGIAALKTVAFDRAVNGVPMTLFYHGEPAATTTRHDNRLLMSLLRHYDRPSNAAAVGGGDDSPTDTATIMWLCAIRQVGRGRVSRFLNAFLLKHLMLLRRDPGGLEEAIRMATYMVRKADVDLDHSLAQANAGPDGMRASAAGVSHRLKPLRLTAMERAGADLVRAHLRDNGPPLSVWRSPLPAGVPDVPVPSIPRIG